MWSWSEKIKTPELSELNRHHAGWANFAYDSIYPYAVEHLSKDDPDLHKISRSFLLLKVFAFNDLKKAIQIKNNVPAAFAFKNLSIFGRLARAVVIISKIEQRQ